MENKSDREKEQEEKERQIQEMLTPSFTIQELASAIFLILAMLWTGAWVWESFFAPSEAEIQRKELMEKIDRLDKEWNP